MTAGSATNPPSHEKVIGYFDRALQTFGPNSRGVDWRDSVGHRKRLEWALEKIAIQEGETILDFGCGYGALYEMLVERGPTEVRYDGFDISASMVAYANHLHRAAPNASFFSQLSPDYRCDVAVAIGTFHVKAGNSEPEFDSMVKESLDSMVKSSRKGWLASFLLPPTRGFPPRNYLRYYTPEEALHLVSKGDSKNIRVLENKVAHEFVLFWQNR